MLRNLPHITLENLLYGNTTDELDIDLHYQIPSEVNITDRFNILNDEYGYFQLNEATLQSFIMLFKACKLIADYTEKNNDADNNVAGLHAYKIMVLFNTTPQQPFKSIDAFIKERSSQFHCPLHDNLIFPIPKNSPPLQHLSEWQGLSNRYGKKAIFLFQRAQAIEELLLKQQEKLPFTLKSIQNIALQLLYKQAEKHPVLAQLCTEYCVSEDVFNKCLEITPKTGDALPDVVIKKQVIVGDKTVAYYLKKLPFNDPRAYILGHITNCCQFIGGHAEDFVIKGITSPHHGFYVLLRSEQQAPLTVDSNIN